MAMRFQRVATLVSQGTSRSLFSSRVMQSFPFTTRTSSIVGLQNISPPSGHRKHSSPCFAWEEKRTLGVTTPEELEERINNIMKLTTEARLCIKECGESMETDYFTEELQSAKVAVDTAGVAYSELLEELALTDEGVDVLNEVRKVYAPAVESLRQELKDIDTMEEDEGE